MDRFERLRKPKFTQPQLRLLLEHVLSHQTHLFGLNASPLSERKRIWLEVTHKINSTSKTKRTWLDIQRRWNDERRRLRYRVQNMWRSLMETGVTAGRITPLEEAVLATFRLGPKGMAERELDGSVSLHTQLAQLKSAGVATTDGAAAALSDPVSSGAPALTDASPSQENFKQEPIDSDYEDLQPPQIWSFEWIPVGQTLSSQSTDQTSTDTTRAGTSADTTGADPSAETTRTDPSTETTRTDPSAETTDQARTAPGRSRRNGGRRRRRPRFRFRRDNRALAVSMRRLASGNAGLRREVRGLSGSMVALREELAAAVGALNAVASALLRHQTEQQTPSS